MRIMERKEITVNGYHYDRACCNHINPGFTLIMFLLKIWRMSNDTRDIKNYLSSKNEEGRE